MPSVYPSSLGARFIPAEPPPGRVVPLGWSSAALDSANGLILQFPPFAAGGRRDLRITLAQEMTETREVRLEAAKSGVWLASLDVRYGCVFQMFAACLEDESLRVAQAEGFRLRVAEGAPVWIFWDQSGQEDFPEEFNPHLAEVVAAPAKSVLPRLETLACLQPFNWLHGCVVDALADADPHRPALARHLACWFKDDGSLEYVGPHSEPRRNELFGLEPVLMFAALVRHNPNHAAFAVLRSWLDKHTEADGLIIDRGLDAEGLVSPVTWISIEAVYTVSYPLALMASAFKEPTWSDLAVHQIQHRMRHLVKNGVICQRAPLGGKGEQPHWGRATAWFLLGLAKTLRALGGHPFVKDGAEILREHATRVLDLQRADGLWSVYLDDPAAGSDTSASAGIATALAISAKAGWIEKDALSAAHRAEVGLSRHLTSDGFLGGVAQLNRGGDALQRGGYRVLGQFALGLYGQLQIALHD